jgi:hypothetical protein
MKQVMLTSTQANDVRLIIRSEVDGLRELIKKLEQSETTDPETLEMHYKRISKWEDVIIRLEDAPTVA